jgi:ribonuclease HI
MLLAGSAADGARGPQEQPIDDLRGLRQDPRLLLDELIRLFPLRMEKLRVLLESLARGESLDESWRQAGFDSREEAAGELVRLAGSLGAARRGSGDSRVREPRAGADGAPGLDHVIVYVDGASRGNPGPAASAAIAYLAAGDELTSVAKKIGRATNNTAEYRAVIEGLRLAGTLGARSVTIRLDSELVARQLSGEYRIKNADLRALAEEVSREAGRFERCRFEQVPREENREADRLANRALNAIVEP